MLADVAEVHLPGRRVPAEAVRVAHADRVDLVQDAVVADERVVPRDAERPAGSVAAQRVDAQDLAVRGPRLLRCGRGRTLPAVARGEVERAVVAVVRAGRRVEVDLLDRVDLAGVADAQDLAAGAAEGVRGRVGCGPLGDHRVQDRGGLRGPGRRLGETGAVLAVHGVELAVALEVRVEGDEPGAGAQSTAGEEVRREDGTDVEVDVRRAVAAEQVDPAVEVGHVEAAGAVGDLAEVVDARVPHEARVDRRRHGFGLGELGELLDGDAEAGLDRIGQRIGDRFVGGHTRRRCRGGCRRRGRGGLQARGQGHTGEDDEPAARVRHFAHHLGGSIQGAGKRFPASAFPTLPTASGRTQERGWSDVHRQDRSHLARSPPPMARWVGSFSNIDRRPPASPDGQLASTGLFNL